MATAELDTPPAAALAPLALAGRIARLKTSTPPLAMLPELLGLDADDLADVVAELLALEWATVWEDCPRGPALVLTARCAELLDVGLCPMSRRWLPRKAAEAATVPAPLPGHVVSFTDLGERGQARAESEADRRVGPVEAAERAEAYLRAWKAAHEARKRGERIPAWADVVNRPPPPRYLVGTVGTLDATPPSAGPCPHCGGAKLRWDTYCVACDAWGLDGIAARPTAAELRALRNWQPPDDGLKGGRN